MNLAELQDKEIALKLAEAKVFRLSFPVKRKVDLFAEKLADPNQF